MTLRGNCESGLSANNIINSAIIPTKLDENRFSAIIGQIINACVH